MQSLRAISTRAEISATSFVNIYNFGDFKGNPDILMKNYFDAFLYVVNWGTHRLMFRIPRKSLDDEILAAYKAGDSLSISYDSGELEEDVLEPCASGSLLHLHTYKQQSHHQPSRPHRPERRQVICLH